MDKIILCFICLIYSFQSFAKETETQCLEKVIVLYSYKDTKSQKIKFSRMDEKVSKGAAHFNQIFLDFEKTPASKVSVVYNGKLKKTFTITKASKSDFYEIKGFNYYEFLEKNTNFKGSLDFQFKGNKLNCVWKQSLSDYEKVYR